MPWYRDFAPYVPVARRRANAAAAAAKLAKKEKRTLAPIKIEGLKIAKSFWGKGWCTHLEGFSDYSNRLPRGRSYVRNGSVVDLQISAGKVKAYVAGTSLYTVTIEIKTLAADTWSRIKNDCTQSVATLIDLLQGRFDAAVMARLTEKDTGLFPKPREISMRCSCPDSARMCKHVAAVLYGVGARLDHSPELLFTLRDVDHLELVSQAVSADTLTEPSSGEASLAGSDLGAMFGIELETAGAAAMLPKSPSGKASKKKPSVESSISAAPAQVRAIKKSSPSTSKKSASAGKRPTKQK